MRHKNGKKTASVFGMLLLTVILIGLYQRGRLHGDSGDGLQVTDGQTVYSFAMGTSVSVSLYGAPGGEEEKLAQAVKNLDEQEISWRQEGSTLYRLNHSYTAGQETMISDTLYVALTQAYNICRDSEGALDITIRPLANLWNIESATAEDFVIPDESQITTALAKTGYESVTIGEDKSVTLAKPGMILDLGAVGKGFALDVVQQILKEDGVRGATISVGGSVLVYGEKKEGSAFRVGIRNPQGDAEDMIGYLEFASDTNTCISTSGDYEKYIEKDGTRYHHILDRKTGYPAESGLSSVTVVCQNGLYSDALSTACYVLGYERALMLLKKYKAEAVFIDSNNQITVTDGLKDQFYLTQNNQ